MVYDRIMVKTRIEPEKRVDMSHISFIRTAMMDNLVHDIIHSIRQRCSVFSFEHNPYITQLEYQNIASNDLLSDKNSSCRSRDSKHGSLNIKDFNKASAYYNADNFDEAELICNEILKSGEHGDSYNLLAHIAHNKGEYEKSISLMHKALELYKTSPIYNNNLGNLLFKQDRFSESASFFRQAIKFRPDYADAHFNLGLAEFKCGNYESALIWFQKTIQLRPDSPDPYTHIGNIYMKLGRKEEAVNSYRQAIALKPGDMIASVNLSLMLMAMEELEQAEITLQNALTCSPDSTPILFNLGNLYNTLKQSRKAIEYYQKALTISPDDPKISYNLGTTFMESGKYKDALPYFEITLKISPDNTQALNNMGMVLYKTGDYQSALNYYQKAIDLKEDFSEAHNNMGLIYKLLEQKEKSMLHFKRAIEIDPQFGEAFHNLAEVQRESKRYDDAIKNSRKAIALQPDLTPAYTHHAYLMRWLCEWDEYHKIDEQLDLLVKKEIEKGETVRETPFMNLIRVDDPAYNRKVADFFAHNVSEKAGNLRVSFSLRNPSAAKKQLTVGYISSNFRYHPLAHLLANLFRHHNREQFQINCYSMGPDDRSEYRKRFEEDSDIFRDIRHFSHAESAQLIYDDRVDILVDLMGYTQGNRLEIAALHPAPIQLRYMGMPGTTGGDLFDYIIVDEIVLPRDQQIHYAEKFIYMPYTYQINDRSKKISQEAVARKMFNLPESGFVFCSFNTSYKIDPVIFSTWMEILDKTEDSVLWLMPESKSAGYNMHKAARQHGIDPERLIYTDNIPLEKHLARIALADIALDTRTVGGAATTSDALWGGVPVITLLGNRFISRMSASILSAIGLNELITENLDEYKKLAIRLANNRDAIKQLKTKLKQNIQTMPLFDTPGFTLHLERAFKKIWNLHIAGEKPQIIDLKKERLENG